MQKIPPLWTPINFFYEDLRETFLILLVSLLYIHIKDIVYSNNDFQRKIIFINGYNPSALQILL